jgi:hypothetical protein
MSWLQDLGLAFLGVVFFVDDFAFDGVVFLVVGAVSI